MSASFWNEGGSCFPLVSCSEQGAHVVVGDRALLSPPVSRQLGSWGHSYHGRWRVKGDTAAFVSGKALDGPWWAGRLKTLWVGWVIVCMAEMFSELLRTEDLLRGCAPELSSPLYKWKALSTEPKDCFSKAVWNSDQFSAFSGKPSCLWLSLELTWERKNNLEGAALWEGGLGHPESQRETVIWGGVLQNSQFYKCEAIFSGHWSKYVLDPGLVTFSVRSI